jgi:xanthine/uracil permease
MQMAALAEFGLIHVAPPHKLIVVFDLRILSVIPSLTAIVVMAETASASPAIDQSCDQSCQDRHGTLRTWSGHGIRRFLRNERGEVKRA